MSNVVLIKHEVNEKIRLNSLPVLVLLNNGYSYVNKKGASLLDLKPGDVVDFYSDPDRKNWYMVNDPNSGSEVQKRSSLMKFSATKRVRQIFESWGITQSKAYFKLGEKLEDINGVKALWINPRAFNLD